VFNKWNISISRPRILGQMGNRFKNPLHNKPEPNQLHRRTKQSPFIRPMVCLLPARFGSDFDHPFHRPNELHFQHVKLHRILRPQVHQRRQGEPKRDPKTPMDPERVHRDPLLHFHLHLISLENQKNPQNSFGRISCK
jgi:hypothetical protein